MDVQVLVSNHPITTHSWQGTEGTLPVVLCIGGSDSAGLAGISMDSRCCEAMGVHAALAITATTAQNNDGLYALHGVSAETLSSQIDAALTLQPKAIKIGLLGSAAQIEMLAHKLAPLGLPIVLDTVLATSSQLEGSGNILDAAAQGALLEKLLPLATVVTPNLPETSALLGDDIQDLETAAAQLRGHGADWVVIKGGHAPDGDEVSDYCHGPGHSFTLTQPRINTPHLRGTGCAFASLLAAALARGYEVRDALVIARMALQQGIENGAGTAGPGGDKQKGCPLPTQFPTGNWPRGVFADLPPELTFPPCTDDKRPQLGLYPIVDRAHWLQTLLPLGVNTMQLRIKDLQGEALAAEIGSAITLARRHDCRLFINDYWQLAIDGGAYGVHLGQEDLADADLEAIRRAGLRLGVSNHCHYELCRALAIKPSYIATGPVYATNTKDMPWVPHGLEGLDYWLRSLPGQPLVAIAGIKPHNIGAIAATGVSGIAIITAVTEAADPEAATLELMQRIEEARSC